MKNEQFGSECVYQGEINYTVETVIGLGLYRTFVEVPSSPGLAFTRYERLGDALSLPSTMDDSIVVRTGER